jgi:hypothetical protein
MAVRKGLTVIKGPKLQTFYTCEDEEHTCEHLAQHYDSDAELFYAKCEKLNNDRDYWYASGDLTKAPINCPLLGRTQEEDKNFDKDVLMRNL